MKEQLRDKTRDELSYTLNSLGVKAEMAERGRDEEKVENSWYQRSLGVLDIPENPIRWINVLKKDGSDKSPPRWWAILGIPEKSISNRQKTKIKTVRKKTFPLFGKVTDVTWKGDDGRTGLVNVLSKDKVIKTLSQHIGNLEIKSHTNGFQGWTLTINGKFRPTNQDWEAVEKVVGYILSSPSSL